MRVLSLFSGQGGFDLGLEMAGMEIVGQVESDPQCQRVLAHHWPDVWRAEDVRSVGGESARRASTDGRVAPDHDGRRQAGTGLSGSVDLICGGFPCQDVSVAGKRAGLDGARSGLWFEFQRIVSDLRPKYVLVENVLGLLSSNQGRDFAIIIDGLGELGYGVSWTVLDSQHFGVAQRRRRVFIVAGPPDGRTEQILAISEGCGGHPETGRAQGEDVANTLRDSSARGSDAADRMTFVPKISYALAARNAKGVSLLDGQDTFVVRTAQTSANGHGVSDMAHSLDGANGQAISGASVRRLTPTECLRLQGFPDDWLDLDPPLSDGPKYRMCGNAVTVSVIEWIGRRMMAVGEALR